MLFQPRERLQYQNGAGSEPIPQESDVCARTSRDLWDAARLRGNSVGAHLDAQTMVPLRGARRFRAADRAYRSPLPRSPSGFQPQARPAPAQSLAARYYPCRSRPAACGPAGSCRSEMRPRRRLPRLAQPSRHLAGHLDSHKTAANDHHRQCPVQGVDAPYDAPTERPM